MRSLLLFFLVISISGCSDKAYKPPIKAPYTNTKNEGNDSLQVIKIGELRFRRSYAIIQNIRFDPKKEKEIEREIEKERKGNPWSYSVDDSSVLKRFAELKMTSKDYRLIRSKFKENRSDIFELLDSNGKKISCRFMWPHETKKYGKLDMLIKDGKNSATVDVRGNYGAGLDDFRYLLLDFVPGGFKEIIILNEYYIMNGDNSDVFIYEVK